MSCAVFFFLFSSPTQAMLPSSRQINNVFDELSAAFNQTRPLVERGIRTVSEIFENTSRTIQHLEEGDELRVETFEQARREIDREMAAMGNHLEQQVRTLESGQTGSTIRNAVEEFERILRENQAAHLRRLDDPRDGPFPFSLFRRLLPERESYASTQPVFPVWPNPEVAHEVDLDTFFTDLEERFRTDFGSRNLDQRLRVLRDTMLRRQANRENLEVRAWVRDENDRLGMGPAETIMADPIRNAALQVLGRLESEYGETVFASQEVIQGLWAEMRSYLEQLTEARPESRALIQAARLGLERVFSETMGEEDLLQWETPLSLREIYALVWQAANDALSMAEINSTVEEGRWAVIRSLAESQADHTADRSGRLRFEQASSATACCRRGFVVRALDCLEGIHPIVSLQVVTPAVLTEALGELSLQSLDFELQGQGLQEFLVNLWGIVHERLPRLTRSDYDVYMSEENATFWREQFES